MILGALPGSCPGLKSEPIAQSRPAALARFEHLLNCGPPKARLIEISGDRWSEKTALMKDCAKVATNAGWQVAAGSAASPPQGVPFGVFAEALDGLISRFGSELVADCPPEHVRWLGGVFPALASTTSLAAPVGPSQIYHVLHAIRQLISAVGRFGNLLLLLDDMHWADEKSMALLAHLLRHPPDGNVFIMTAQRPRQFHGVLPSQVANAERNGTALRILLAPLSERDAAALLPGDLSASCCAELLDESGGNPGLLRTLVSLRTARYLSCGPPPQLPSDVFVDCLRDFRELSANGWLVARSAAVLDDPFEPGLLKEVAQLDDDDVWAALDELIAEDVIRVESQSSRLRFANRLLRATAYHSAGPGWMLGAHTRVADALIARGEAVEQVAGHLEHAVVNGDEEGARILLDGARECLWTDPLKAVSWVKAAAHLNVQSVEHQLDHRLLLAKALALAGKFLEASRVLDPLVEGGREEAHRGEAMWWRAWVRDLTGRFDDAGSDLDALLAATPPDRSAAPVYRAKVVLALRSGKADREAVELLTETRPEPSGAGAGHVAAVLAAAACREGDYEQARRYATTARSLTASPDADVEVDIEGVYWLAYTETELGEYTAAMAQYERGLRICEQRQLDSMVPHFAVALGSLQSRMGDFDGAVRHAACAGKAATRTGNDYLRALAADLGRIAGAAPEGTRGPMRRGPAPSEGNAGRTRVVDSCVWDGKATTGPERRSEDELESLSGREMEIALLVSDGRTNQQIARRLELSHKTVETYLARIFKKLVVSSRAEVAATVGRSGQSTATIGGPSATAAPTVGRTPDITTVGRVRKSA
ncbi:ATP-binding protein [Nocardiopsis ansamitocini]|uniref:LuxR family transcriptional regulator n=1 Tax=Nocardiopsis ansamitocini TaxID=1670832 RepID=A0A9W6PAS2_9ACTN|nr:LuxR C-terminal-related transcriptional regulator [Nocardiopsis ansamitocini]GLU50154.1 LuxR family transcriptional regulator [Nocardiopsis ansamitocini]